MPNNEKSKVIKVDNDSATFQLVGLIPANIKVVIEDGKLHLFSNYKMTITPICENHLAIGLGE